MPRAGHDYKDQADQIATERGGRCLSATIPSFNSRAVWKCCDPDHPEWTASFASVKGHRSRRGAWCERCLRERFRKMRRLSTAEVRARLLKLDIELVSKEYTGINDLIECSCLRCDHVWPTRLRHINHGHGCPECGKKKQAESKYRPVEHILSTLKERRISVIAIRRGKPRTMIDALCTVCGHEWTTSWNELQQGRGCPPCGRRRMGDKRRTPLQKIKTKLASWGIELLSSEYHDNKTKLHVRFECGHDGLVSFNSLDKGNRCRLCAPNARVDIEDYRKLARKHGGKILNMARTTTQPSQWKCRKRIHPPFWRPYNQVKKTGFCPKCSEGFSERVCRAAAEQLFSTPFWKIKLRGVRGVGGRYLELDGYSEPLKLAIEHNGLQHYQPVRFGDQTEAEAAECFGKQQEHDRRRREFCSANGITLIEVPTLGRQLKPEDLKEFIRAECRKNSFKLPDGFDRVRLKLDAHNLATTAEEMWERVLKRVRETGYTLRSINYPGANGRLLLVCRNNHPYNPRVARFLKGDTCRRCLIHSLSIPVVALALGPKAKEAGFSTARVFDSFEDCAKAIGASSNSVRIVAQGRGNSSKGFGVAKIAPEQAARLRESKVELERFCRATWPSPESYDKQGGSRRRLSKPVKCSDGRVFPSRTAAAKALGVSEAAIYHAAKTGRPCRGLTVRQASV